MNLPSHNLDTRLKQQLARLYVFADTDREMFINASGLVRALVIEVRLPADWKVLSTVWYGVQTELDWPAPAIAVSGTDGIQLWCSLAEPVDLTQATDLLSKLKFRFLQSVSTERIRMFPSGNNAGEAGNWQPTQAPTLQESSGNWSAFVSQDLAAIFFDEPWLDLPPNPDQQADLLSKLRPIKAHQIQTALKTLNPLQETEEKMQTAKFEYKSTSPGTEIEPDSKGNTTLTRTPKDFLFWAMNNPQNSLKDRIEAAKALLPYSN